MTRNGNVSEDGRPRSRYAVDDKGESKTGSEEYLFHHGNEGY